MNKFIDRVCYKLYKQIIMPFVFRKRTKIFLIGGPEHGNLGDHLIAMATANFLRKRNVKFIELPYSVFYKYKDHIIDDENNLMLLQGGGNFGNEYIGDDDVRLHIVQQFPKSKVVIMPQTMYYTADEKGEKRLNETKEIFAKHKNLTICAREKVSYEKMKQHFTDARIELIPDIVLSNDIAKKVKKKKKQILFLMRHDLEKVDRKKDLEQIENWARENGFEIKHNDTVKNYNVNLANRNREIKKIFNEIQDSQLVVTDRLHGMISSYINNVPVVVFPNYNHKITSSYEWLKNGNVVMFDEKIDLNQFLEQSKNKDNENLEAKYSLLDELIKK